MSAKPHGMAGGIPFWFIPDQLCPRCGHRIDCASSLEGQPQPGAGLFCGQCVALLIFKDDLYFREATQAELDAIAADPKERKKWAAYRAFTELGAPGAARRKVSGRSLS